ncbi:helix-turn-helix domain-containing protein [Spongiactinospora sp. TRM90649]|uniref:GbsR/MarR family transcriptional regulator n=1 Tax=Spongiactinospora sp. TRM90649 TaxID=3031114 RepID=UPI0023F7CFBD|nr:helix-turn-helix domain-containing protein [Spongiactinospora sp. TRM90649]MDF5754166.1 helix-turn-helix domain-containing protein [Spongiactinospora sp. TRM90649]
MPGGRLTHEDRRLIAGWLAEGLGYAEMARRLSRPTSTITREVGRNGGPGGYLADQAQETTARRARRGERARAGRQGEPGGFAREFVEEFAVLLSGTGLPRMPSRVFVCLLTADGESLTSAELVHRLRVSPASVSKAIGYLETMDLVRRAPDPGGRRERYLIDDDVWLRAWRADTGAHADVAAATRRGAEIFGPGSPAAIRLHRMGRFFDRLSAHMDGGGLTEALVSDALTLLAALLHAGPLTTDALTAALNWPAERTAAALEALAHHPAIAGPLTLEHPAPGTYAVTPKPDLLTGAQREALDEVRRSHAPASPAGRRE